MGEGNYRDIVEGRPTHIYVPYISGASNSVSIFAFAYYKGGSVDCYFQRENDIIKPNSKAGLPGGNGYRLRHDLKTTKSDVGGWYTFTCAKAATTIIRRKTIHISIIAGTYTMCHVTMYY